MPLDNVPISYIYLFFLIIQTVHIYKIEYIHLLKYETKNDIVKRTFNNYFQTFIFAGLQTYKSHTKINKINE